MLILNVDDDEDDREMFCDAIHTIDSQISCIQVDSGEMAIKFLVECKIVPDYIFLDINMPTMNGYECLKEIRALFRMGDVPIVMFSTSFNPKDLIEFADLGIKYVNKVSEVKELVRSLRDLINKQIPGLEAEAKR